MGIWLTAVAVEGLYSILNGKGKSLSFRFLWLCIFFRENLNSHHTVLLHPVGYNSDAIMKFRSKPVLFPQYTKANACKDGSISFISKIDMRNYLVSCCMV